MYKATTKKLQKKAIYSWQQEMDKFIVFPLSWGFFNVEFWSLERQFRPFWVLYWNPVPGAIIVVDGDEFEPDPDTIYLFPPHTEYMGKCYKPFIQLAVHFLAESPFDRVVNKMLKIPAENISKLLMKLDQPENKLHNSIILEQIILSALSKIPTEAFESVQKVIDSRIYEALNYIDRNPGMNHTVRSLSKKFNMSDNNFHRYFIAGTGITPKQYALKRKMEYTRFLLTKTEKTIDEIALETGFADRYHFSKTFKKHFSYPPAEFRKKMILYSKEATIDPIKRSEGIKR